MNRLADEASPYLRQHADNPVDWWPWSEAAFAHARAVQKPIFLSVGYSTCHWCHVMAHESFEDAAVAERLNRDFVPVKVDREERPDVDRVYMTFVQATTGAGGWPMSVWLTPDLRPFYGGTYFPPQAQWGRPSFTDVLAELARAWREERERLERSASHIMERLAAATRAGGGEVLPGAEALPEAVQAWARGFDRRRGGFGDGPKFPRPSELLFLLREYARAGDTEARDMALFTLRAMALGGMRDHVGGGFHRYAVDGAWRVPHFEKMLYDQAQLVLAYVEAAQVTGDPYYAQVAEDTLQYVERDLTHPEGGFFSAEDADSIPPAMTGQPGVHGVEGAFYTWTLKETRERLGDDSAAWERRFGLEPDGNAPFDPQGEFGRGNLLYTAASLDEVARAVGRDVEAVSDMLARARQTLFLARAHRPRPHLDDKVITAWNGLMIAAAARASRLLRGGAALAQDLGGEDPGVRHLRAAQRAAQFVRTRLWDAASGRLQRRWRDGQAGIEGFAEDYACLAWGLLELFQADGDPSWLQWALQLHEELDARFADEATGGWFSTAGEDASVLLRLTEDYDGAEPSATSVAVGNLLVLHALTGDAAHLARARRALCGMAGRLTSQPRTVPLGLAVLSSWHATRSEIVLVEPTSAPAHDRRLADVVAAHHLPFAVTVPVVPTHRDALHAQLPWTAALTGLQGQPTAYVCHGQTCDLPCVGAEALEALEAGLSSRTR